MQGCTLQPKVAPNQEGPPGGRMMAWVTPGGLNRTGFRGLIRPRGSLASFCDRLFPALPCLASPPRPSSDWSAPYTLLFFALPALPAPNSPVLSLSHSSRPRSVCLPRHPSTVCDSPLIILRPSFALVPRSTSSSRSWRSLCISPLPFSREDKLLTLCGTLHQARLLAPFHLSSVCRAASRISLPTSARSSTQASHSVALPRLLRPCRLPLLEKRIEAGFLANHSACPSLDRSKSGSLIGSCVLRALQTQAPPLEVISASPLTRPFTHQLSIISNT